MGNRFEAAMVGDIVAVDFRAATVFERFGIDFCCGGRRSLAEACNTAAADPDVVIRALESLPSPDASTDDVTAWPLERLIDHIITTHHAYVRQALPAISGHLGKLNEVHGVRHPELARVAQLFELLSSDLHQHMVKEERVLFPYVREIAGDRKHRRTTASPFGTVGNPIRMMEREHEEAAALLERIRSLTNQYTAPADGCATYRVCMVELDQFEKDLHRHVHLENNILFPKALDLEREIAAE